MSELRTVTCPSDGVVFQTTNPRKMFCNKQCSDRSRNLPSIPVGWDGEVHIEHFNRYPTDVKQRLLRGETELKVVGFDLECTSLKPNIGRTLVASFIDMQTGEIETLTALDRGLRKPDVFDDEAMVVRIRDRLEQADIIVGHNSKNFDLKFLNGRLLRTGRRTKRAGYHLDTMWGWRSKTNAFSGLDNIQKFINRRGESKTPIEWSQWMRALGWNKKLRDEAMAEIVQHCEQDVKVLRELYQTLVEADVFRTMKKDGGL